MKRHAELLRTRVVISLDDSSLNVSQQRLAAGISSPSANRPRILMTKRRHNSIICYFLPIMVVVVVVRFWVGIAEIFIGALNFRKCPIDEWIPIYLLVSGVVGLILSMLELHSTKFGFDNMHRRHPAKTCSCCFALLLFVSLVTVSWSAWGSGHILRSYWTFDRTHNATAMNPRFCEPVVMVFAFFSVVVHFVMAAVVAIFVVMLARGGVKWRRDGDVSTTTVE